MEAFSIEDSIAAVVNTDVHFASIITDVSKVFDSTELADRLLAGDGVINPELLTVVVVVVVADAVAFAVMVVVFDTIVGVCSAVLVGTFSSLLVFNEDVTVSVGSVLVAVSSCVGTCSVSTNTNLDESNVLIERKP